MSETSLRHYLKRPARMKPFTYDEIFQKKNSILFVTAHPDDADILFGGLITKLTTDGKEVTVLVVTNGARGSREHHIAETDLAKQRLQEETSALQALGVKKDHIACLGYKDGEVESNFKLIGEIARYIRKTKADLVATHEPGVIYAPTYANNGFFIQHRDHRKTGEAVLDAVYPFSRDRSFFPEQYKEGIEPHSVYDVLLSDEQGCNFDFDFGQFVEKKKNALRAHKSQLNEESVHEIIRYQTFDGTCLEKFKYLKLLW